MPELNRREIWVGTLTLFSAILVFGLLAIGAPLIQSDDYRGLFLIADFGRIDGLSAGSPVRMAGVGIGRVSKVSLGAQKRAVVTLEIFDPEMLVPNDTAAVIETDGIFGEKYVELHPGGDSEMLSSGQRLSYSHDSVVLENLLNQIVARAKADRPDERDEIQ